ncbi:MAG: sodium/proton-translocating pyrophosphatase, partial [Pseudomonadota bacterium]|nr:sodium/proton-translocating pyrophosphatase [Pseudomonadota bacterium]
MESYTMYAPILGVIGLLFAGVLYSYVVKQSAGNDKMKEISDAIHSGAMAFLRREYKILAIFVIVVFALLYGLLGEQTAYAFLGGAICSVFAGYFGMVAATR